MDGCEDYLNKFLDCETTIIFTKDPQYIVNAHSWPDEIKKKEKEKEKEKEKPQEQSTPKTGNKGFIDSLGKGVGQIFNKSKNQNHNKDEEYTEIDDRIDQEKLKEREKKEQIENLTNEQIKQTQEERDKFLISEMRKRLDHYFRINVTQMGDTVPKIITNFLINDILVIKINYKE